MNQLRFIGSLKCLAAATPLRFKPSYVQLRSYSLAKVLDFLPDKLIPKCKSCGIQLQSDKKDQPGFFIKEKAKEKLTKKKNLDDVYANAIKKLNDEDKILLANGAQLFQEGKLEKQKRSTEAAEAIQSELNPFNIECLRCRHVKFYEKFENNQFPIESPALIMERVPPWANLVYVVSAQDFPMSLESKVFEFWPALQIQFVVSKADLFFPNNKTAQEKGLRFFQDYFERTYKVPPEQVFIASGHVNWGISNILLNLKDDSFFIGSVNSGKSTLLQSLIYVQHLLKSGTSKKKDNESAGFIALQRQRIKQLEQFKEKNGPGVSFMPGFTRNVIPFELAPGKTVFDVPGFDGTDSGNLPVNLLPGSMKRLQKGEKFHKRGTYLSHYETAKEGQCLTVGGLFFLSVPKSSMYRIRNMISHELHIFKNHEKAISCWKNMQNIPELKGVFVMDNKDTELFKYEVPPFVGSIDLVFKNLGYITITATGAMPDTPEPAIIYLPRHVTACVREPMSKYITKTLSGRDKKGRVLPKEDWVRHSTKEMKRYVGREPMTKNLLWLGSDADTSNGKETS